MSAFHQLKSATMTGAEEVRVITLNDDEIAVRAREAFIFAHPAAPLFVRKMARSGRLDWALASARQAMRDIEKPVDFLTHEARAAWVLNTHAGLMGMMDANQRAAIAQIAVTAIRVGTKDFAAPPTHTITAPGGWIAIAAALAALIGAVLL